MFFEYDWASTKLNQALIRWAKSLIIIFNASHMGA